MVGYMNNEVETANTLRTHADGNVWLHTGDLGKWMRTVSSISNSA